MARVAGKSTSPAYRTTALAEETDPNKLHDLKAALNAAQVYTPGHVQEVVELFFSGADRDQLDPILDTCVAVYINHLDEDQQVDFKGKAKRSRARMTSSPRSSPIPTRNGRSSRFCSTFLRRSCPRPRRRNIAKGILEAIDMDSYRVETKAIMKIALADADAEIEPVPTDGGGRTSEPELDRLR